MCSDGDGGPGDTAAGEDSGVEGGEIILVDDAFHTPAAAAACVATQEANLVRLPDTPDAVATNADFFARHTTTQVIRTSSRQKKWHQHASSAKATKARHGNLQY